MVHRRGGGRYTHARTHTCTTTTTPFPMHERRETRTFDALDPFLLLHDREISQVTVSRGRKSLQVHERRKKRGRKGQKLGTSPSEVYKGTLHLTHGYSPVFIRLHKLVPKKPTKNPEPDSPPKVLLSFEESSQKKLRTTLFIMTFQRDK